uniref:Calcitonin receptor n=1 Tax=Anabas testudineus TaxID=64144 RepID=A0A7N6B2W2_ANATE
DMWRTLVFSMVVAQVLGTNVSTICENFSDMSAVLRGSRKQILAAQFECYLKIINEPQHIEEGPYCNRTWDGWLCWGDSVPGTATQMCPDYFHDFDSSEKVTKVCNPDGLWFHHPESKRIWTNYTECQAHTKQKLKFAITIYYLAMVGHSLSIVSLIICLIIFSYFKSLSCQRISLHKNMFLSFIFNSIVTIMWLSLTMVNNETTSASNSVSCKILSALSQYTSTSNYFWMLCEGIYLHTLIIVAVFVGEQQLFWYYVLGWGFPIVPAVTYAVARGLYFNDRCWISSKTFLLYITHGPIQLALLVNLFFLLNIVRVLITKLRETHCAESMAYMKAVRATLILIPLLGAQFILLPLEPQGHISHSIYEFFMNIFVHFQVKLTINLRRKWAQWKSAWGKTGWGHAPVTNNHFNYHTNSSITETSRMTISLEQPASPTSDPSENLLSTVKHNVNGQQNNSSTCKNGEVTMLNKMEDTDI